MRTGPAPLYPGELGEKTFNVNRNGSLLIKRERNKS